MKKITKLFASLLLFILSFSLFTACNDNDSGNGDQNPPQTVSSNEIINQSIDKIEDMMTVQTTIKLTSYVAPNNEIDYNHERLSVLRGAGLGIYFSEYIANSSNGIEDNVIYKDVVSQGDITLNVYAKKTVVDSGVVVTLENHMQDSITPIYVYFNYDYNNNKPLNVSIVQAVLGDNSCSISVAKFDFIDNVAYSYNFYLQTDDITFVKTSLAEKTFTFDTLSNCNVQNYLFAKLNPDSNTILGYSYKDSGDSQINATYTQVETLYNEIYQKIKDVCVPVNPLDVTSTLNKVYYVSMYSHARDKVMAIQ